MEKSFIPEVLQVVPSKDYTFFAYFNDGTIHHYDASSLVSRNGIFSKLRDKNVFQTTITVMNGTVAWDFLGNRDETKCLDLDPFDVYAAPVVADPLEQSA